MADTLQDKEPGQDKKSDAQIYGRLLSYVLPYWGAILLSILGFLIYSISNVGFLQLISYIVDSLKGDDPLIQSQYGSYLGEFIGGEGSLNRTVIPVAIVAIVIFRGLGTFIGNYFVSFVSTHLIHNLRCELFDQLLKLPSRFYDKNAMGHLVAKVTFHVTQVAGAATDAVRVIIREGFTVLGYLAFLLYMNWQLTLIFFAVAPIIAMLVIYAGKRFRKISGRIQHSMGDVTHVASEAIQGYRVVRTFGGIEYERKRFQKVSQDNRRQQMKMVVTSSINTPLVQVLVAVALAGLVWLVLEPSLLVSMSAGNVVAFITTGGLLAKPIRQLSEVNSTVQKGLAAAEDIFDLFDEEVEDELGVVELNDVKGLIEFRDVSFAYADDQPDVLRNINFVASAGETIALVGRSGSGKSTLASLIPCFYSPTSGSILIDNHAISTLSLANLRHHIALVTQQVTLFNDTIRRNIAYGSLQDASEKQVIDAAKKAYAWEFITEMGGLDTVIGDDGVLLSGGQRQRLAIARAFLKDAPILILDEATSALDSDSEQYIQSALESVSKGRTTFIIAHRLTTIEKADRILVLDKGNIVEEGTHASLLSRKGYYAGFYNSDEKQANDSKVPLDLEVEESAPATTPDNRHQVYFRGVEPLLQAWYTDASWVKLLRPLGFVCDQIGKLRRHRIESQGRVWKSEIPLIVVGNINIGGTGKSPLVIAIVQELLEKGFSPGVVSRGYGGSSSQYPLRVSLDTDPKDAGDEAVMIARRTHCPVVVDPDRVRAASYIQDNTDCDVIISDDGLQHYALGRDVEIVVIDGVRGLGNGLCLPAGPLRESPARLAEVDFVIVNGKEQLDLPVPYQNMELKPTALVNLTTGESLSLELKPGSNTVHAIAGIGNPGRFFQLLRDMGFDVIEHSFTDHHKFQVSELDFKDSLPVIMTEKDAVKCQPDETPHSGYWYLEVNAELPSVFITSLLSKAGLNITKLHVVANESIKV